VTTTNIAYVPSSHLDLYWLGSYQTCLERGATLIRAYLDRCLANPDETFLLETVVFADYFLQRYPEYREPLLGLIREGRVDIGTVFVDRWEHLILGESHIRNIQVGAAWSEAFLGHPNPVATHPDLPGLVAQTSQIYAQANVRYYVTSRKVFEDGAVWRHRSPDGTELTFLNWPKHYIYYPIELDDLPVSFDWLRTGIDVEASGAMFPLGTIPVNGGAGDLTDPGDFRERYGASLQDLIAASRVAYPDLTFGYTVPSRVLAPYDGIERLPVVEGEIPSVWGVACDETVEFFRRNRQSEYQLLAAETLAVVLDHLDIPAIPPHEVPWQGRFYESAFFAAKDPIPAGQELAEIWKMHLFTEDHNGGGYEAALSTFQKRQMQGRVLDYTGQIIDHGLRELGVRLVTDAPGVIAFNPLGQPWTGGLRMTIPSAAWDAGMRAAAGDPAGTLLPQQMIGADSDGIELLVQVDAIPSVGYCHIPFVAMADRGGDEAPVQVERTDHAVVMACGGVAVEVDGRSGAITRLHDGEHCADWGRPELGAIRAIRETGNDVTLRTDNATAPVESTLRSVSAGATGPLFSSIRIEREVLGNTIEQDVSLWHDGHLELEVRIRWSGAHNWQLRLALPTSPTADGVAYGSPFHGSGWTETTPLAAPRNGDEILLEDYGRYREVQEWVHVRNGDAGLLQVTTHPGFCFGDRGLEAVLLRSAPSCGDTRFFWENAGEQVYRFAWYPTGGDWRSAGSIARAQQTLRPPVNRWVEPGSGGRIPKVGSFLSPLPDRVVLSSLSRNVESGDTDIRVLAVEALNEPLVLEGPLVGAGATVEAVDLTGRAFGTGAVPDSMPAWRIQTFAVRATGA